MFNKLFGWLWLNHPRSGTPDAMLTFAAIAIAVCAIKFLANGVSFTFHSHLINLGTTDSTSYAALLGPTVFGYCNRKNNNPETTKGGT